MIRYSLTHDEAACCGCSACEKICSVSAIQMKANQEGFMYPEVDREVCIRCGACSRVCPMGDKPSGMEPKAAYALRNRNEEQLLRSSSGGAFSLLADYVINIGGCVAGCIMDNDNKTVFKIAERTAEINAMQGSKYLSSNPGIIFQQIKDRLIKGQTVFFSGAPCQNAALMRYLDISYDNLITADFLCHGMPSQKLFEHYIGYLERKYHGKVYDFKFRDKSIRGWGLVESFRTNNRKHYYVGETSTYLFGYTHGFFNRYSCYSCPFRGKRFTDFTISDYWGSSNHHSLPDSNKGVSAVTVNTSKARDIFETIKNLALYQPTKIEWIAEENPSVMFTDSEEIPPIRREIYQELDRVGWKKTAQKELICSNRLAKMIWYRIPRDLARKIKKILRKG